MPHLHAVGENLYEQLQTVRKNLSESTASYWTDLEIYNGLNQAQTFITRKSKSLKKKVTVTTVASTQEYALIDNSFGNILDISDDGVSFKINGTTYQPLNYTTKKNLNMKSPGWRSVSASTPQDYYYDKASKTIGLYPKPNSSNTGAYLDIFGYYLPPILLAGTASSGSTTTIVVKAGTTVIPYPSTTDSYYNNIYIEIYSGTGAGQRAKITAYTASTRTITAAFTTAPDSTSIFGMVSPLPPECHYLMPLYALWKSWPKGGSRSTLGQNYKRDFIEGLALFLGEMGEADDEDIVRETYR